MTDTDRTSRLHFIVDAMLGRKNPNALAGFADPFDVTPPNQHENKQEFLAEKNAVEAALGHIQGLIDAIVPDKNASEERRSAIIRVRESINEGARKKAVQKEFESVFDLITKNAMEHNLYFHTFIMTLESKFQLDQRLEELNDQEQEFWSVSHRAPNYHARFVALRLARLYSQTNGEKPTVGVARDGGHPSTEYTRALEQVFEVLDIKAHVRGPAKWAVEQLTDDDLKPPENYRMGGILGAAGLLGGFAPQSEPTLGGLLAGKAKDG